MIKIRINGRVREFETAEQYEQYLEAQNPKPKKKRKKVDYKAVEEDNTEDNGEA